MAINGSAGGNDAGLVLACVLVDSARMGWSVGPVIEGGV